VFQHLRSDCQQLKLVLAGRVDSILLKWRLRTMTKDNVLFREGYLSAEQSRLYLSAANVGFLSYRSILTSGALFHLMSAGLPVIAPRMGTIPAYVVEGWNGFTYSSPEELERVLRHCVTLSKEDLAIMGENSLALASALRWDYLG
jgi:glycosyltransferase involved in cell wall biosynthesis